MMELVCFWYVLVDVGDVDHALCVSAPSIVNGSISFTQSPCRTFKSLLSNVKKLPSAC
eukprot:m.18608 g.18608  ORF g.18608 m.18608 type:complete len:58 (+) comp4985_c0_seq1:740-913(+)